MNKKTICIILAVWIAVAAVLFFASKEKNATTRDAKIKIEITTNRDGIIDFIEEKGIKVDKIIRLLAAATPEIIDITAVIEPSGMSGEKINFSELSINGYAVPKEVLADISEKFLDFKCSLVYN